VLFPLFSRFHLFFSLSLSLFFGQNKKKTQMSRILPSDDDDNDNDGDDTTMV
jgi:hypothetical protein